MELKPWTRGRAVSPLRIRPAPSAVPLGVRGGPGPVGKALSECVSTVHVITEHEEGMELACSWEKVPGMHAEILSVA